MRNTTIVLLALLAAVVVAASQCGLTEPSHVGERQVRAYAPPDSTVVAEGWLDSQGGDWVEIRSCDGTRRWILYGSFILENTEVCR